MNRNPQLPKVLWCKPHHAMERRARVKLVVDLSVVVLLMAVSVALVALQASPMVAGCGTQIPLALQAILARKYRL